AAAVLGLEPGVALAAPGFDPLQHQPALLWATLLAGGTYVHLTQGQLAEAPARLWEQPIGVLGVTLATRELIRRRGERGGWRLWFKNAEGACDGLPWCSFVTECAPDSEMCNVLAEAASGGALLASPRRRGSAALPFLQNVVAAPGLAHTLLDVGDRSR